ncbi:MAG: RNA polymerase sigma-70 factor (ECF subfamily) [Colwellia sp.]|jgi:RNA polymerase sigma-70 factor (ECF subfamily)
MEIIKTPQLKRASMPDNKRINYQLSNDQNQLDDINNPETIARLKADPDQFWPLWQTINKSIANYCYYRLTKHFHDAEDLCSDTMLKAYEKLPELKPDTKIIGWIYQLARNIFFDQLRKRQIQVKHRASVFEDQTSENGDLFKQTFNKKVIVFATQTINKVAEKYRLAAFDHFFKDKDYKQISIELNQSEAQVRKLIFRVRKQIAPPILDFIQN